MTVFNPEWRVKVDGSTVTPITLNNISITGGRKSVYEQPAASYASFSLLVGVDDGIDYEVNDTITIEIKKSNGTYVVLFGGYLSDISIAVRSPGSSSVIQEVRIVAVGALARLTRANFSGNLGANKDGDQIYELLQYTLLNSWNEVAGSLIWSNYEPTTTWANAENTGLGEIDRPGDYDMDALSSLNGSVYDYCAGIANSALGYLYEDNQGRLAYADSTHRSQYLASNGYTTLDANQAYGTGLEVIKRAGDVRNKVSIQYKANQSSSESASDTVSIGLYGELATTIPTTLKNQTDAAAQAAFYLTLRAYPQFELKNISFPLGNPEISDSNRDKLLAIEMGLPVNIQNLPGNMGSSFQGFVEGWTWRGSTGNLTLDLILSPTVFSIQAMKWELVDVLETWNTLDPALTWINATIVA